MADTDSYEHLYDLPETTSTIGTDVLPIEQSDGTKKIGVQNLLKDATSYADIYTKSQTDTAITDKALTLQGNITAAVNAQATINTNLAGNFASGYSPSATYRAGDYCTYQNVLYKCTTAITTPEAWNASHWTVSKLADNVDTAIKTQDATNTTLQGNITSAVNAQATVNSNLAGNFASEYSPSATYAVNAYCTYQNVLYKCTTAITTPEAWNSAHWTAVKSMDELAKLDDGDIRKTWLDKNGQPINFLLIDIDPKSENNMPCYFGTDDASKFLNSPITSGIFIGFREVRENIVGGMITVILFEQYPMQGRIWNNTYNTVIKSWYGWKKIEPVSI